MDFLKLSKDRYSVRDYDDRAIEDEVLTKILEAGRLAPTAKNNQPQVVYVLKSEDAIKKIRENTACSFNAPIVLMVCANRDECWTHPETSDSSLVMDASIVCCEMMMAATSLGVGSCWVLRFDKDLAKKQFNLPQNIEPVCLLPLGYPSKNAKPSERHEDRKLLSETVKYL